MRTNGPPTLLLFPTEFERARFGEVDVVAGRDGDVATHICGFGPVAAAARTAELLHRVGPGRVILIGIAGTYDPRRLPIGAATTFDEVVIDGVGVGQGADFLSSADLGFNQWPGSGDSASEPIASRLELESLDDLPAPARVIVTTCAASASLDEAAIRHDRYPDALAEDMEAFGVALACALHDVPLAVVRGISNVAGDRQKGRWVVEPSLDAARQLVQAALRGAFEDHRR